jgi:hypothetical protein
LKLTLNIEVTGLNEGTNSLKSALISFLKQNKTYLVFDMRNLDTKSYDVRYYKQCPFERLVSPDLE